MVTKVTKAFRGNLFFLITMIILIAGSVVLAGLGLTSSLSEALSIVLPEVIFLLVPALIYIMLSGNDRKAKFRFNKLGIVNALIIILIVLFAYPISQVLGIITQLLFKDNISETLEGLSSIGLIGQMLVIALTPAICEEIVFRGVVLSEYKRINIKYAAIANGFIFALFHLNPYQFLYTFFIGIILAYLVYITDSFFAGVLGHFTFNGVQVILAFIFSSSVKSGSDNVNAATNANLTDTIVMVILVAIIAIVSISIIYFLIKLLRRRNEDKIKMTRYFLVEGDGILNWPLFVGVALYLVFVILVQVVIP